MIYFDNNATTQIDPIVLEAMMPFLTGEFANPSSTHKSGVMNNKEVRQARQLISEDISARSDEIIFTSGATEAINLAIKGIVEASNDRKHIITSPTEHSAVLDVCSFLESRKDIQVSYLHPDSKGIIDPDQLKAMISDKTLLVSVMLVNNEIGVIQPIREIAEIARSHGAYFMTDATQAMGKIPINVDDYGIDLMSFSGHKIYGPKGIGGLFVRKRRPGNVHIIPLQHGGGHEFGMRSGTLNVPGIIGLSKALEIALNEMNDEAKKIRQLRDRLESSLLEIDGAKLNGHPEKRIYGTSNICFHGVDSDAVMAGIKDIAISKGSACSADSIDPSHVLKAIGLSDREAFSSLRFSLGRFNTAGEVDTVVREVRACVEKIKAMY